MGDQPHCNRAKPRRTPFGFKPTTATTCVGATLYLDGVSAGGLAALKATATYPVLTVSVERPT